MTNIQKRLEKLEKLEKLEDKKKAFMDVIDAVKQVIQIHKKDVEFVMNYFNNPKQILKLLKEELKEV